MENIVRQEREREMAKERVEREYVAAPGSEKESVRLSSIRPLGPTRSCLRGEATATAAHAPLVSRRA